MTDESPKDEKPKSNAAKSSLGRNTAIGIGSAAVAAALLYAGKRFLKKPMDSSNGPDQANKAPSGEPPETD
ncbi:MAG: isopropylmalate isomerase [Pseudomonadota bacterium]